MIMLNGISSQIPLYFFVAVILNAILYLIQRFLLHKKEKWIHYFWSLCLIIYILILYDVCIGFGLTMFSTRHRPNLLPFVDLIRVYDMGFERMMMQVFLNIVLMIPFGFLLPVSCSRLQSFSKTCFTILGVSVVIEIVQYFIGRSADIDDVIMNFMGGVVGYFCFKLYEKIRTFS